MLPDEAIDIADDEHARLTAKAEAEGIAPTFGDCPWPPTPPRVGPHLPTNSATSQWPLPISTNCPTPRSNRLSSSAPVAPASR